MPGVSSIWELAKDSRIGSIGTILQLLFFFDSLSLSLSHYISLSLSFAQYVV